VRIVAGCAVVSHLHGAVERHRGVARLTRRRGSVSGMPGIGRVVLPEAPCVPCGCNSRRYSEPKPIGAFRRERYYRGRGYTTGVSIIALLTASQFGREIGSSVGKADRPPRDRVSSTRASMKGGGMVGECLIEDIETELNERGVRVDIARDVTHFASRLSDRDQAVLFLVLKGKNGTSIANITGIPQRTVSWVMAERFKKLPEILLKRDGQAQYSNREGGV
jgi:hypothetical protein